MMTPLTNMWVVNRPTACRFFGEENHVWNLDSLEGPAGKIPSMCNEAFLPGDKYNLHIYIPK